MINLDSTTISLDYNLPDGEFQKKITYKRYWFKGMYLSLRIIADIMSSSKKTFKKQAKLKNITIQKYIKSIE